MTAEVIGEISNHTEKPVVTSFMGGKRIEASLKVMCQRKVPNYSFPEKAISAVEAMHKYTLWRKKPIPEIKRIPVQREDVVSVFKKVRPAQRQSLDEDEAKQVID